ncbi:MAG: hypothetical protein VX642_08605, partial [Bdellovibrionota bacterium]|nr:hypothetical protein [Bdellovibrionota bacterium]
MKASDAQDFAKVKLKNYDRNEACKFLIDLESKGEVVGEEASSSSLFGQKCESLKLQSIPIPVDYA